MKCSRGQLRNNGACCARENAQVRFQLRTAFTLLPVSKVRLNARRREGPSHSKQDGGCVFSGFRTSRLPSFVFMQTFSPFLLLTDKTLTAVKVIYLLIKKN